MTDRIKAATARVCYLDRNNEERAVLGFNDAAVKSGKGLFYLLPLAQRDSLIPNLLYVDYVWTEPEREAYWKHSDANRYLFIQGVSPPCQISSCLPDQFLNPYCRPNVGQFRPHRCVTH